MKHWLHKIIKKTGLEIRISDRVKKEPARLASHNPGSLQTQELKNGVKAIFFGYHDKTPFSADNSKILACSVAKDDRDPESECSRMDVGYFERTDDGTFNPMFQKVSETTTWCWQQGCMLQWNPLKPNSEIVFNRMVGERYGSVIYNLETSSVVNELQRPVYSLDPAGRYAATLNFSRLGRLRPGYGYSTIPDPSIEDRAPEHDGLFLFDLQQGSEEQIVNLEELSAYTNKNSEHYINHAVFSPDGEKLTFFHLYAGRKGERNIRFFLYHIPSKKLELLEARRSVSHYCWRNDHQLFTTEVGPEGCSYFLYDLNERTKTEIELPNIGDLHPMFSPADPDLIAADSKPDGDRNQYLFLFNIKTGQHTHIGTFHSPPEYSGRVRCDLHPRWDREGEQIVVDTAEGGKRKMVVTSVHTL